MNPCDGPVPCLELYAPPGAVQASHMFTGSSDGAICVWKAGGDWQHLKIMRGHKSSVNSISVHPSGKLALSVARSAAALLSSGLPDRAAPMLQSCCSAVQLLLKGLRCQW
jgi:WD40 repeat protein